MALPVPEGNTSADEPQEFDRPDRSEPHSPPPCVRAAAATLRARGFALCKPDAKEKAPTYEGWSAKSLDAADFNDGDEVGILGGPLSDGNAVAHALVIIDLDTAEAVARADGHLPPTGMAEGRPGKPRSHRYYLVPNDSIPLWAVSHAKQAARAAIEQKGHAGPFKKGFDHRETGARVIDFVGTGGQCVCPPARHPSGERREWDGDLPGLPAVVPFTDLWRAVCELASACGAKIPDVLPRPPSPPRPPSADPERKVIERALKYLAKMEASVAGSNGHGALFKAARALVYGFDLPPAEALSILRDEFNPRCQPAWSERELEHKVEDADRVPFDKPRGWLRDAERPNPRGRTNTSSRNPDPTVTWGATPGGDGPRLHVPPGPRDYPPPDEGEAWSDPHRLARLYMDDTRTADGERTVLQWRDEYHTWEGAAWRPVADSDLDADVARHCREVFVADMPGRLAAAEAVAADKGEDTKVRAPTIFPVTGKVKTDVKLNLAGLVNLPDSGADVPFWRQPDAPGADVPEVPDAADVIAAPNGLFTIGDIAADRGAFSPPTPRFFTPNALPFPVQIDPPQPTTWLRCVGQWFNGDTRSTLGLQEAMGYFLTANTCAQDRVVRRAEAVGQGDRHPRAEPPGRPPQRRLDDLRGPRRELRVRRPDR